jgi:CelD/BcsL family acetyltransferase involved in cellulose biosynthesis
MTLVVKTFSRITDFAALASEWDALEATQTLHIPFRSSTWNRLWWKHFRRKSSGVQDCLRLTIVRDAAGALVAVAPMMLTHRPARLPIRTRELQFLGADSNVTELRGMLCLPGHETAVLEALSGYFATRSDWDWIQWRGLPGGQTPPLADFRSSREVPVFYLPLPATWEALQASLSRNMKEALRKCYNSLARDKHEYQFRVLSEPAEISHGLTRLLDMHTMRAAATGTIRHPDVFAAPHARRFIAEFVDEMAARGGVRIFALNVAGVAIAMRLGFLYGNELYLYYSGYDPAWGQYSVMTTVVAEAIKWAISQGYQCANLSTGADSSKARWRPTRVDYLDGLQPSPTWRGQLALAAMEMVRERIRPRIARRQAPSREERDRPAATDAAAAAPAAAQITAGRRKPAQPARISTIPANGSVSS